MGRDEPMRPVDRAALVLAAAEQTKSHGQLCPVSKWVKNTIILSTPEEVKKCNCWILPEALGRAMVLDAAGLLIEENHGE
jgi:hypothetical protein